MRARNFATAWGLVQFSQGVSVLLGAPITGYLNAGCGGKAGYVFSAVCVIAGGVMMTVIDVHKKINRARYKYISSSNCEITEQMFEGENGGTSKVR